MPKKDGTENTLDQHVSGQANKPLSKPAHALSYGILITEIEANPQDGLTSSEARLRLDDHGRNELGDQGGVSITKILVRQVANAMMLVLLMALVVSFAIGSWVSRLNASYYNENY
jgi:Na+-exporting ATPase